MAFVQFRFVPKFATNLAAWLDNLIKGHLWSYSKTWDPEGILSTLPAVATGILGVFIVKY
jgi:predicted acyltransferase